MEITNETALLDVVKLVDPEATSVYSKNVNFQWVQKSRRNWLSAKPTIRLGIQLSCTQYGSERLFVRRVMLVAGRFLDEGKLKKAYEEATATKTVYARYVEANNEGCVKAEEMSRKLGIVWPNALVVSDSKYSLTLASLTEEQLRAVVKTVFPG